MVEKYLELLTNRAADVLAHDVGRDHRGGHAQIVQIGAATIRSLRR